jgi:hypothetical protein
MIKSKKKLVLKIKNEICFCFQKYIIITNPKNKNSKINDDIFKTKA